MDSVTDQQQINGSVQTTAADTWTDVSLNCCQNYLLVH